MYVHMYEISYTVDDCNIDRLATEKEMHKYANSGSVACVSIYWLTLSSGWEPSRVVQAAQTSPDLVW